MEPRREIDLAAELLALRPTPRRAFATELDERAAGGFPRRPASASSPIADFAFCSPRVRIKAKSAMGRVVARLRVVEPRRMLVPAGATALAGIVAVSVAIALTGGDSASRHIDVAGSASSTADHGSLLSAMAATGAAAAPAEAEPLFGNARQGPGPYASHVAHRDVERSAQLVLGDDPADVRPDAAKVFETVQAYDGIVMRSSISDGGEGEAGASFRLLIPSGRLGDAIAAFSGIADVLSRRESTNDVTAPTVGLGERLQDARAKVQSLLAQLAGAETEAERATAEAKLRSARSRVAALRAGLTALQRRTHLSSVWLRIETGGDAGASGGWSIGDALHDAGRILAVAAGVSLIGLAIVAPLALLGLLAWLARRTWIRRSRERALG